MDRCPYCGYDISEFKQIEYVEIEIEKDRNGNGNGNHPMSKETKEAIHRSTMFLSHNWYLSNPQDLRSMFCKDCGKTPVELGFWERVDPYTLEVINHSKGWMNPCRKRLKLKENKKEIANRQDNTIE